MLNVLSFIKEYKIHALCRVDEFFVECPCLGTMQRLRIGHDNSGAGPGWFLDKVIVDDMEAGRVYDFPCQRWLAKDEDDGSISRDLLCNLGPLDAPPGKVITRSSVGHYKVINCIMR